MNNSGVLKPQRLDGDPFMLRGNPSKMKEQFGAWFKIVTRAPMVQKLKPMLISDQEHMLKIVHATYKFSG